MQPRIRSEKFIQAKIFFSYTLLVIMLAAIVFFAFTSLKQLTHSTDRLAQPNPRVDLLHKIVYSIYRAESNIRSYSLNQRDEFLNAYFNELNRINQMVDSLQLLAEGDTIIRQTIDSINIELLGKTRLLDQFIVLKKLDVNSVFYHQAMENILQATNGESRIRETTHQTIVDTLPSTHQNITQEEVVREKSNFFDKLKTFFTGKRNERPENAHLTVQMPEKFYPPVSARTDSIVTVYQDADALRREIENTMSTLFQKLYSRQENLRRAETRILLEDKRIMDRIWSLVIFLEEHEREKALSEAAMAHTNVGNTTIKIMLVLLISILILIFFSWLLFNDINKSRYYRQQLMAEKARAEELVKVKQRFMANISHEIRTPLNSIVGFSEQLLKGEQTSKTGIFVDAIHQSSKHLLEIVNDILDFSKMEAGKVSLELEPVNIEQIANDVYVALEGMAQAKQLEFVLDTASLKNKWVYADSVRIRQILFNLAGNAVKFTNQGWVKLSVLTVNVSNIENSENIVRISVEDTGIGIEPSQQEKIFEEFSQADSQSTRQFGGTGLGLTITRKLVEMMNGQFFLESIPGEGSEFRIEIPLLVVQEPHNPDAIKETILPTHFSANILLVDDDRLNRLLINSIFEPWKGLKITEAEDPQKALEILAQNSFDLIITDVQMPGMTGMEMAVNIRNASTENKSVPIIACTADITPETITAIHEAGINDYLLKPFSDADLKRKLMHWLDEKYQAAKKSKTDNEQPDRKDAMEPKEKFVYSIDGLRKFTGDNPVTLSTILKSFREDTLNNVKLLEEHLLSGNRNEIHFVVHKMSHMFELLDVDSARDALSRLGNKGVANLTNDQLTNDVKQLIEISFRLLTVLDEDWKIELINH